MLRERGGEERIPEYWERSENMFYDQQISMTLLRVYGTWRIVNLMGECVAEASSNAQHPVTVLQGQWRVFDSDMNAHRDSDLYFIHHELITSPMQPIEMEDLGVDYFVRMNSTKILWYVDPHTRNVYHSGAKADKDCRLGKRYCSFCHKSFSANNFVSQHMRNLHSMNMRPGSPVLEAVFVDECIDCLSPAVKLNKKSL